MAEAELRHCSGVEHGVCDGEQNQGVADEVGDTYMYPPAPHVQKKAIELNVQKKEIELNRMREAHDMHMRVCLRHSCHQISDARVDGCARASGRTRESERALYSALCARVSSVYFKGAGSSPSRGQSVCVCVAGRPRRARTNKNSIFTDSIR